jgi:hypothetical protein
MREIAGVRECATTSPAAIPPSATRRRNASLTFVMFATPIPASPPDFRDDNAVVPIALAHPEASFENLGVHLEQRQLLAD